MKGKAIRVANGNTITILDEDNMQIRIRLYGINCPKSHQGFGTVASANIDNIFIDGKKAIIAGDFSTKMLQTSKVVNSLFFIQLTIENNEIIKYRLLEDSYAVSVAMDPVL